ncbi:glycine cleavage system protein GcvH [Thermogladius sp. 4427co]|uniref:glycine cleavage system protein GcvH n=1 Tax=Thermogladius sp. 4427co TaxID=3450718 RepID=UPI003F798559
MSEIVVEIGRKKYIVKTDRLYTNTDEWVKVEGNKVLVGITDYAQKELRDIVSVELPEVGSQVTKGKPIGAIDSVKATSNYYSPVTGRVTRVNEALSTTPELLNKDPYGEGWIVEIEYSNPDELKDLLTPEAYIEKIKMGKH